MQIEGRNFKVKQEVKQEYKNLENMIIKLNYHLFFKV